MFNECHSSQFAAKASISLKQGNKTAGSKQLTDMVGANAQSLRPAGTDRRHQIKNRFSGEDYNIEQEYLFTCVVLVVLWSVTTMVFLIGLDPISFPVRGSFLGRDITNLPHGRELHAICTMFRFSTSHVVGNANIH